MKQAFYSSVVVVRRKVFTTYFSSATQCHVTSRHEMWAHVLRVISTDASMRYE